MEEKNMTSPNETKEVKKVTPKQPKHSDGKESDGFADYKAEFKKIEMCIRDRYSIVAGRFPV